MQVYPVFFERLSRQRTRGFSFTSYSLAKNLQKAGMLGGLACIGADPDLDLPPQKVFALDRDPLFGPLNRILSVAPRLMRKLDTRFQRELLFDRFLRNRLPFSPGDLLFLSRPLFLGAAAKARARGLQVWVQTSIPHPLENFALVRNEEIRLGLDQHGPYSDFNRAARLAKTISCADRVITLGPDVGPYPHETYQRFCGPDRIIPLRNIFSTDIEDFSAMAASRRTKANNESVGFLHLSHINLIKGVQYLLEAWKILQDQGTCQGRLVLAGRSDPNVQKVISRDFSDLAHFEYRGFVEDLPAAFAEQDVFVSPSVSDNGPGTIIEAMAAGMPVISSLNCGLASLVEPAKNGFTYAFNDVPALAECMSWFCQNPGQVHGMGKRARQKVEGLGTEGYVEEILGHFEAAAVRGEPAGNGKRPAGPAATGGIDS